MVRSHKGADEGFQKLIQDYPDNPFVRFVAYDNKPGTGLTERPVAEFQRPEYTGADERLLRILEAHREKLPERVTQAALGKLREGRGEGVPEVRGESGPVSAGEPASRPVEEQAVRAPDEITEGKAETSAEVPSEKPK